MASSFRSIGVRFTAAVRPLRVGTTNRTHVRRTVHHHAWACRCRHGGPLNRLPASRKPGSAASTTRPSPGAGRRYCCAIPRRKGAHDEVDTVSACSWGLRAQHGDSGGWSARGMNAWGSVIGQAVRHSLTRTSTEAQIRLWHAPPSGGRACALCSPPSRTRRRLTSSPPTRAGRSARTAARPPRRVPAAPAGREAALPLEEHAQRRPERTPRRAPEETGEKPAG